MPKPVPPYIPSPTEIARKCRQIRAQWSDTERVTRIVDDATRHGELGLVHIPELPSYSAEGAIGNYRRRPVLLDT